MKVVRFSILFSILFFINSILVAQVIFDIQAGISNTGILSDKNQNANFRTDLNTFAGVALRLEGEELVGIQFDLLYERKGANYIDEQYKSIFNLQYVTVSPLANFQLSESLALFLGPYFSFRIDESHEVNGQQLQGDKFDYLSDTDDVGLRSGFRYYFSQLFFQMHYSFGLTDIRNDYFDTSYGGPIFPEGLYNKSFSVGLGFTFD